MNTLTNPFKLFGAFFWLCFRLIGYSLVLLVQIVWFGAHRRRDEIGQALGHYGKSVIDAIYEAFHK